MDVSTYNLSDIWHNHTLFGGKKKVCVCVFLNKCVCVCGGGELAGILWA